MVLANVVNILRKHRVDLERCYRNSTICPILTIPEHIFREWGDVIIEELQFHARFVFADGRSGLSFIRLNFEDKSVIDFYKIVTKGSELFVEPVTISDRSGKTRVMIPRNQIGGKMKKRVRGCKTP